MTIEERIDWENLSYRMDEEFHKLRKEYLLADSKLERYVNTKLMEEVDDDYE